MANELENTTGQETAGGDDIAVAAEFESLAQQVGGLNLSPEQNSWALGMIKSMSKLVSGKKVAGVKNNPANPSDGHTTDLDGNEDGLPDNGDGEDANKAATGKGKGYHDGKIKKGLEPPVSREGEADDEEDEDADEAESASKPRGAVPASKDDDVDDEEDDLGDGDADEDEEEEDVKPAPRQAPPVRKSLVDEFEEMTGTPVDAVEGAEIIKSLSERMDDFAASNDDLASTVEDLREQVRDLTKSLKTLGKQIKISNEDLSKSLSEGLQTVQGGLGEAISKSLSEKFGDKWEADLAKSMANKLDEKLGEEVAKSMDGTDEEDEDEMAKSAKKKDKDDECEENCEKPVIKSFAQMIAYQQAQMARNQRAHTGPSNDDIVRFLKLQASPTPSAADLNKSLGATPATVAAPVVENPIQDSLGILEKSLMEGGYSHEVAKSVTQTLYTRPNPGEETRGGIPYRMIMKGLHEAILDPRENARLEDMQQLRDKGLSSLSEELCEIAARKVGLTFNKSLS